MTTAELTRRQRRAAEAPVLSPSRVLGAVVLAAWAGLFWWLIATGRTALYLSTRTGWLVPAGAVILTIALAGRLFSARTPSPEPVTRRDALGSAAIIVPVVIVLALPPAALGSYAASRRSSLVGAGAFGSSTQDISTGTVTLFDVAGGLRSRDGMRALVARAGTDVSFVGFVDKGSGMPADEFLLTRFLITCCVADALSIQVRVVGAPPGKFASDDWVRVSGQIYPLGREVIVNASDVVAVPRPKRPYLNS